MSDRQPVWPIPAGRYPGIPASNGHATAAGRNVRGRRRCDSVAVSSTNELSSQGPDPEDFTTVTGRTGAQYLVDSWAPEGSCLLGSLTHYFALRHDRGRIVLATAFSRWQGLLASALSRLQAAGDLDSGVAAEVLATGVITTLQGGYLPARTPPGAPIKVEPGWTGYSSGARGDRCEPPAQRPTVLLPVSGDPIWIDASGQRVVLGERDDRVILGAGEPYRWEASGASTNTLFSAAPVTVGKRLTSPVTASPYAPTRASSPSGSTSSGLYGPSTVRSTRSDRGRPVVVLATRSCGRSTRRRLLPHTRGFAAQPAERNRATCRSANRRAPSGGAPTPCGRRNSPLTPSRADRSSSMAIDAVVDKSVDVPSKRKVKA